MPRKADHRGRIERRSTRLAPQEIRTTGKDAKTGLPTEFTATVLRYGVVDDYRTKFRPGVFDASLEARMPRVVWAHDWTDPIGRYDDVVTNDKDRLTLHAVFDSLEDVPSARRAASQLQSGTIDQFSVGFYREAETEDKGDNTYWIEGGDLVEASPVLEAAVPGTSLDSVRSRRSSGLLVPVDELEHIFVQSFAGNLSITEALAAVKELAVEPSDDDDDDATVKPAVEPGEEDPSDDDADVVPAVEPGEEDPSENDADVVPAAPPVVPVAPVPPADPSTPVTEPSGAPSDDVFNELAEALAGL
jgi:HK97 family phage prohead protease